MAGKRAPGHLSTVFDVRAACRVTPFNISITDHHRKKNSTSLIEICGDLFASSVGVKLVNTRYELTMVALTSQSPSHRHVDLGDTGAFTTLQNGEHRQPKNSA